jgi:hypothetical protein
MGSGAPSTILAPDPGDFAMPEQRHIDLAGSLPELRRDASGLPSPSDVPTREILGLPIAMTDYVQAMDVMDGMVAKRERGYVCAVAVHAVMVAQGDAEMKRALLGSTLTVPDGMPLV